MLTRLSYIDFNIEFLKANINGNLLDDKIIEKYALNVVEGIQKLSNWAKNLKDPLTLTFSIVKLLY